MARRRSSTTRREARTTPRGKSPREARVERLTWVLLVLAFGVVRLLEDAGVPNWMLPLSGAAILFGSALYQYTRRWRVSPVTWIAAGLMTFFTYYSLQIDPTRDFSGLALIVFAGVILFGVITGDT
jgi:hypothetical protein